MVKLIIPKLATSISFVFAMIGFLLSIITDFLIVTILGIIPILILIIVELLSTKRRQQQQQQQQHHVPYFDLIVLVVIGICIAITCGCMNMIESALYSCTRILSSSSSGGGDDATTYYYRCDDEDVRILGVISSIVWMITAMFMSHTMNIDDASNTTIIINDNNGHFNNNNRSSSSSSSGVGNYVVDDKISTEPILVESVDIH